MSDEPQFTVFGRIAILTLAIEWIVFGSMHFSHPVETIEQLPGWIAMNLRLPIVIGTGIAEVAAGVLILLPETRRYAAITSLALLVLLTPAMYEILASGAGPKKDVIPEWLRLFLLPNNIFLTICSVYLYRHPKLQLAEPRTAKRRTALFAHQSAEGDMISPLIAGLLLMANVAGFTAAAWPGPATAVSTLWAMACIAVGALIGFLFAVPRINPAVAIRSELIPNANVEAVSDWLTKILVGVGLVNFQAIGRFVDGLAVTLSDGTGRGHAFALGLIVYFFAVGVIQGYVLTRVFLSARFRAEIAAAQQSGEAPTPQSPGAPCTPAG